MRLRTKLSCIFLAGVGASMLATSASGCVSDDNAAPSGTDSGIDSTVGEPDTGTPQPEPEASTDTGTDAPVLNDAGQDSAVDTGVDAGCSPSLPVGWTPPAYVPAIGQHTDGCQAGNGPAQIDGYWTACLGDASTPTTCAGYLDAGGNSNANCAACLVTPQDASAYGAAVVFVVPQVNVAGCLQIIDPTDAGQSCATALQATQACVEAACRASCPVTSDPATVAAYTACTRAAATSACATIAAPALACVGAYADAGGQPANECLNATTTQQEFDTIGFYFCGS